MHEHTVQSSVAADSAINEEILFQSAQSLTKASTWMHFKFNHLLLKRELEMTHTITEHLGGISKTPLQSAAWRYSRVLFTILVDAEVADY